MHPYDAPRLLPKRHACYFFRSVLPASGRLRSMEQSATTRGSRDRASQPTVEPANTLTAEERDQRLYEAVRAFQTGNYDESEAGACRLLQVVPGFFPAVLLRGMIAARTKRTAEGIAILQ